MIPLKKANPFWLLFFMLGCGALSVWFGKELCWDLAHYHFYIPFAFWHDRTQLDFWPSSYLHQYLNPTIDFLTYALIQFTHPWQAEFILGALHGLNVWLIFLIARLLLKPSQTWLALFSAVLSLYGATAWPGMGSFQNDNLVSVFVLATWYFLLRGALNAQAKRDFIYSGLSLGIALGLKLTAGIYLASSVIWLAVLPFPWPLRFKRYALFLLCTAAAYLAISGYWLMHQWVLYHNPLFPFFNTFFKANGFPTINWRDARFIPQNWQEHLFFPFYFALNGTRVADAPFYDLRFAFAYGLFFALLCKSFFYPRPLSPLKRILYATVISSFIIWQEYFAVARYLVAIEFIIPLTLYSLAEDLVADLFWRSMLITAVFARIVLTLFPMPMVRARWYDHSFFNVQLPPAVAKLSQGTVLVAYTAYVMDLDPRPQSYLIPFFPSGWHFIGVPFWHGQYLDEKQTEVLLRKKLQAAPPPFYLLTSDFNMPTLEKTARALGYTREGDCLQITSDRQRLTHQETLLCEVRPLPETR